MLVRALLVPNSFWVAHSSNVHINPLPRLLEPAVADVREVRHCVCKSTASKISLRIMLPQGSRLDVIVRLRLSASLELLLVAFPRWNGCRSSVIFETRAGCVTHSARTEALCRWRTRAWALQ